MPHLHETMENSLPPQPTFISQSSYLYHSLIHYLIIYLLTSISVPSTKWAIKSTYLETSKLWCRSPRERWGVWLQLYAEQ